MKSNRQARRLFGAFGKISNTRRVGLRKRSEHWCGWDAISTDQFRRSRRQSRSKNWLNRWRVENGLFDFFGQHTQGERE